MAKKIEVKEVVEVPTDKEVVEHNNGVVVTNHLDRRDSGTNYNESKPLPSLDDQTDRSTIKRLVNQGAFLLLLGQVTIYGTNRSHTNTATEQQNIV